MDALALQHLEEMAAFPGLFQRGENLEDELAQDLGPLKTGEPFHGRIPDAEPAVTIKGEDPCVIAFEQAFEELLLLPVMLFTCLRCGALLARQLLKRPFTLMTLSQFFG